MDQKTKEIYKSVYSNSILFLKRAITEIVSGSNDDDSQLSKEQGIIASTFIQSAIELAFKSFLIKEKGVKSILISRYNSKSVDDIYDAFKCDTLKTKSFEELKKYINREDDLSIFDEKAKEHIDKLQKYRNKLLHLNLHLNEEKLKELKTELIYSIVHIIIPTMTDIDLEYESPSQFYENYLNKEDYKELISFGTYVKEMEKIAKDKNDHVYPCIECYSETYSPDNGLCYSCNLNFHNGVEFTDCKACNSKKAIIFDPLNIAHNGNILNGLCLKCRDKPNVFKCPNCGTVYTFYIKEELENTCYSKCLLDD